MNCDLLIDNVFGVVDQSGKIGRLSLPALFAGLGDGSVQAFSGTQRHQVDPLHMFLAALGASVLIQEQTENVQQSESFWRKGLQTLAGNEKISTAWHLIVDDPAKPAFLQPPLSEPDQFSSYKSKARTPDELDILQTAKNHDVKSSRIGTPQIEAWCHALIGCQTMNGFLGAGNYGIVRMNGGFASRPCVTTLRSHSATDRWTLETSRLLHRVADQLKPVGRYKLDGHCLLWTVPWDGTTALNLEDLHPYFIEVCRMVRLLEDGGAIQCLGKPSKTARIFSSKETRGNVGDPWSPLRRRDNAALTVGGAGFTLTLLTDLIIAHESYEPAPMQRLDDINGDAWFHVAVLVRGQGTTDGYHEHDVLIPGGIRRLLLAEDTGARSSLSELSKWAMEQAGLVQAKCLRPALFSLMEGGPQDYPDQGKREFGQWIGRWLDSYRQAWQDAHFPWLWSTPERKREEVRLQWLEQLHVLAESLLEQAIVAAPKRSGRQHRARVRARGLYHFKFNSNFQKEMGYDYARRTA